MNQHMNMAAMNSVGGPVGGTPVNHGDVRAASNHDQQLLNTYIYDYLVKNKRYELARSFQNELKINTVQSMKESPGHRDVNGVDDNMDADAKDGSHKRPSDLPVAQIPTYASENSFLYDWWCQFWDIYSAQRDRARAGGNAGPYLAHNIQQSRVRQHSQQRMLNQLDPTMMNTNLQYRNMVQSIQPNGMVMPNELQKRAIQNNRNAYVQRPTSVLSWAPKALVMNQLTQVAAWYRTPQQMQHMKNMQQQHLLQQTQMQREGSNMDMGGQRPQSPGAGDNAPSPKRQRLEGQPYNGQMGPAGRAQGMQGPPMGNMTAVAGQNGQMLLQNGINPNELPPSQMGAFSAGTPNVQQKSLEVYAQNMANNQRAALSNHSLAKGMNPTGVPQGSPMNQPNVDGVDFFQPNGGRMAGAPSQSQGNHALQDYQMQLMLLEQQNKKRLLMARQEQDNLTGHHGPPGSAPGQGGFAPAMSPQNSRAGPSPNPNEQMKRGTPKMSQPGLPGSPMPDAMGQTRGSPVPSFDPNQAMPSQYYMPANGMMRPPSSHPNYGMMPSMQNMTPQQMEAYARQNGGRMPNGAPWPQGPPQLLQQNPGQQPQMGTPQQRHGHMPPPPAPAGGEAGRTQPSSPQQPAAPPTPSQAPKSAPKGKKEANKETRKKPAKKGSANTGATPAAEAEPPTPSTPVTPSMHTDAFRQQQQQQKNGANQPGNVPPSVPVNPSASVAPPQLDPNAGAPFGTDLNPDSNAFSLDFANVLDSQDVLENFDFDSFLHTDDPNGPLPFDQFSFGGVDGVEADTAV